MRVGMTNIFKLSDGKLLPYFLSLYFIHCPDCFFPPLLPEILFVIPNDAFSPYLFMFSLFFLCLFWLWWSSFLSLFLFLFPLFYDFEKNFFSICLNSSGCVKWTKNNHYRKQKKREREKMPRNWDGIIMKT